MDALLFARYRKGGGDSGFAPWEFSSGMSDWEQAPAPALVGKRLVEGLFERQLPAQRAALVNNITHWAYGILGGVQYGVVAESLRSQRVLYGAAVRRERVGCRLCGSARREAVQADLGIRHTRPLPRT